MYNEFVLSASLMSAVMFLYFSWLFTHTKWYGFVIYKMVPFALCISNVVIALKTVGLV